MKRATKGIYLVMLLVLGAAGGACSSAAGGSNTSTDKTVTVTTTVTWAGSGTSTPAIETTTTTATETAQTTKTPVPPITATKTLETTATTSTSPITLSDQGIIEFPGQGDFKYQRVFERINEAVSYEGVTFAPHDFGEGVTPTGPIQFYLDVSFADGATESLSYVALGSTGRVVMDLTQHNNPRAGVMLFFYHEGGSLRTAMFLLVSV